MLDKKQNQQVEAEGIALQGGRDVTLNVTNTGLSYSDVKAIARDEALALFIENFPKLQGEAMVLAATRGEEITENFFAKLLEENPSGIQQAKSPDFQDALFTVQKEYAKAGDEDLGQLLVDLLVDRTKTEGRNILQIVLNESLHTAPKLTSEHLAVLAVTFFFRRTRNAGIGNLESLKVNLSKNIEHFAKLMPTKDGTFEHLQFTGCGSVSMGSINLEQIFQHTYCGLFNKGFEENRILELGITLGNDPRFFIPCLNDFTKIQVRGVEKGSLKDWLVENNISTDDQQKIESLFQENLMSEQEIKVKIIEACPFMDSIFTAWASTKMQNFELTSVGMAIGHANIKRLAGEFTDLSIWIN